MSQISFSDLANGTYPDASDFNTRFNALKNRINNGMELDNIADSAITTAKINNGAVTYAKFDSQIVAGATTVTADLADYALISDTSDSGNVKKALLSDIVPASTQAQMEAVTSNVVMATPLNIKWHPAVAKGWIVFDGTSGSIGAGSASHNVSSVTDNGTGNYTVNWTTSFSSANYVVSLAQGGTGGDASTSVIYEDSKTAGGVTVKIYRQGVGYNDMTLVNVIAYGDQ